MHALVHQYATHPSHANIQHMRRNRHWKGPERTGEVVEHHAAHHLGPGPGAVLQHPRPAVLQAGQQGVALLVPLVLQYSSHVHMSRLHMACARGAVQDMRRRHHTHQQEDGVRSAGAREN